MSEDETLERAEDAPPPHGHAHLVVVAAANGAAVDRGIIALDGVERVDIGRTAAPTRARDGSSVVIGASSATLSRRHAWIARREDGVFVIEDGGSKNGTELTGRRVERAPLEDGDWISCGPLLLRFRRANAVVDDARALTLRGTTCDPRLASELTLAARVLAEGGPVVFSAHEATDVSRFARALHTLAGRSGPAERLHLRQRRGEEARSALTAGMASCEGGTLLVSGLDGWPSAALSLLAAVLEPETEGTALDVGLMLAASAERAVEIASRLGAHLTQVPPLVERGEDLGLLLELALPEGTSLAWSSEALARLTRHTWPGDERELAALVRSLVASESRLVSEDALPAALRDGKSSA